MSATIDTGSDIDLLAKVRIAKPCTAEWADMQGDERSRFCQHCQKHVYNLSSMTAADASALIRAKEGKLCGMFYQRADGTMLTADCPVGVARHWQRAKAFAGAAVATLVMTFASVGMARQAEREGEEHERGRIARLREQAIANLKDFLGIRRPVAMPGMICLPMPNPVPAPAPTTNAPRLLGEVYTPPTKQPASTLPTVGQK